MSSFLSQAVIKCGALESICSALSLHRQENRQGVGSSLIDDFDFLFDFYLFVEDAPHHM